MTWPSGQGDPYGQQPGGGDPSGQQPGGYDPYGAQQPYSAQPYSGQPQSGGYDPYGQQAPGYQQAQPGGYPPQGGYQQPYPGGYQQPRGTNTMAILSLVFAFVFAPLGIVFGHMAKKQIKERGEDGAGLATAGMIIGYVATGLGLIGCCVEVVAFGAFGLAGSSSSSDYDNYTFILQSFVAALRLF